MADTGTLEPRCDDIGGQHAVPKDDDFPLMARACQIELDLGDFVLFAAFGPLK